MKQALIIFVKNPELGKVKTRLAVEIGDQNALEEYLKMIEHTAIETANTRADRFVFYSQSIIEEDSWNAENTFKVVQDGEDLGERMLNAFRYVFRKGYNTAVIIGTDCLDLKQKHVNMAYKALREYDFTLGPSKDGGYYLLGMNILYVEVFQGKKWSTSSVAKETIGDIKSLGKSSYLLPELNDIDTVDDLVEYYLKIKT